MIVSSTTHLMMDDVSGGTQHGLRSAYFRSHPFTTFFFKMNTFWLNYNDPKPPTWPYLRLVNYIYIASYSQYFAFSYVLCGNAIHQIWEVIKRVLLPNRIKSMDINGFYQQSWWGSCKIDKHFKIWNRSFPKHLLHLPKLQTQVFRWGLVELMIFLFYTHENMKIDSIWNIWNKSNRMSWENL